MGYAFSQSQEEHLYKLSSMKLMDNAQVTDFIRRELKEEKRKKEFARKRELEKDGIFIPEKEFLSSKLVNRN